MTKKLFCTLAALVLALSLAACNKTPGSAVSIAYITDGTPMEDGWMNQAIWNTMVSLHDGVGVEIMSAVPKNTQTETLLGEIKKLHEKGANLFVLPGYIFADALQQAQILYPDCRFVALDFAPQTLGQSVVSVSFDALEAGFMAGFAAALRLEKARFGAILGVDVPSCQQYSWGFQQGVLYANANYGTQIVMYESDFIYAGTMSNDSLGQQLAAQLYDSGVDCIFIAAGKTGDGALIEAKLRRANGDDIWAVGSEYSQFNLGIYDGNNSVVVTTAIKRWNDAIIDITDLVIKNKFPGQSVVTYNAANGGVGIPTGEYNLTVDMRKECEKVAAKLAKGDIKISHEWYEGLIE